jgi:hypothetical protein
MDGVFGPLLNRLRTSNHYKNNTENRQENQGRRADVKWRKPITMKSAQKADERISPIPA